MIPKYFRCGDPSQNCPLAVSREIIKEDAKWACPCSNPTCADFRETVSWAEGVTRGRPWIIYGGAAALVLAFVLILLLGGRDPCPEQIAGFQARQAAIEAQIAALQSGSKPKTHSFGGSDQAFYCAPDKFNSGKLKKEKISTTLKIREELRTNSLSQNSRLVTEEE